MVSIAGSKKLKRQMAPTFWGITRKDKRFVITVRPGPHQKNYAIPTAVFLRDTLKLVTTLREAKSVIYGGKVMVDGIKRKSLHHALGLMDVIELDGIRDIYRLVPQEGHVLSPIKISDSYLVFFNSPGSLISLKTALRSLALATWASSWSLRNSPMKYCLVFPSMRFWA